MNIAENGPKGISINNVCEIGEVEDEGGSKILTKNVEVDYEQPPKAGKLSAKSKSLQKSTVKNQQKCTRNASY